MERLEKAKNILNEEKMNFVLISDHGILKSADSGIYPIYSNYLKNNEYFNGATVADRVIGRAAAILLADGGIKEIYTDLISIGARDILKNQDIMVYYSNISENILNKDRDGLCPMEGLSQDSPKASELIKRIGAFFDE